MVDYINIGGENRPVRFGMNAIRLYSEEYNVAIDEVDRISKKTKFSKLIGLFYYGLKDGARADKKDFPYDVITVSDWFDEDVNLVEQMTTIWITQSQGNPQKPGGNPGG